ncbi:hypothetical protein PR003_g6687 [Phytophthora rubi]|uniref:Secreted protein n=1 Tax=Phytophthora rubi TaxID=129364 RepID=A0A6A4FG54_9STRA|nr:hypothetical protein PR002_g6674 [Phytophthora rubi]KAE9042133.1 hypothetical protein PR001_g6327 [Phytophthora rubi]KAE9347881.1 hypothetical protein PR003_g6687 [Phytophthora rubi]
MDSIAITQLLIYWLVPMVGGETLKARHLNKLQLHEMGVASPNSLQCKVGASMLLTGLTREIKQEEGPEDQPLFIFCDRHPIDMTVYGSSISSEPKSHHLCDCRYRATGNSTGWLCGFLSGRGLRAQDHKGQTRSSRYLLRSRVLRLGRCRHPPSGAISLKEPFGPCARFRA